MTFPIFNPQRHWGCRVNDRVVWEGFHALIVQNEMLQIVILVDKGAEIVQFLYKPLDIDFLWHSPNPLRAAGTFVPIGGAPTSPFFDRWSGGWFEVAPNGGTASNYKGASLGFLPRRSTFPGSIVSSKIRRSVFRSAYGSSCTARRCCSRRLSRSERAVPR